MQGRTEPVRRKKKSEGKQFDWRKIIAEEVPKIENRDPKNIITR